MHLCAVQTFVGRSFGENPAGTPGIVHGLQEGSGLCFNPLVLAPPMGKSSVNLLVQNLGFGLH